VNEASERYWLFLEYVPAWRLTHHEEQLWHQAARWVAELHVRTAPLSNLPELARRAHLLIYDADFCQLWPERALDTPKEMASRGPAWIVWAGETAARDLGWTMRYSLTQNGRERLLREAIARPVIRDEPSARRDWPFCDARRLTPEHLEGLR
jgi:hypothetical protein